MAFLNETGLERLWTHIIGRLNGLVQSSRTINGQPLTEDIVLTPDMIGADTKGSASTALTQAKSYTDSALNTAKSYSDANLNTAKSYTDSEIAELINSAPTTLDTLGEIATAMEANEGVVAALDAAIGSKAASSDLTAHTGNGSIHVTAAEKTLWNSVEQGANKTVIDSALSASSTNPVQNKVIKGELDNINGLIEANAVESLGLAKEYTDSKVAADVAYHANNTTCHVMSEERTNWNAAKTHADSTHAPSNAEKNQNAFSNITVGSTTVSADTATDTVTFVGSNVTITPDATNDKITFTVADGSVSEKGLLQLTNSTSSTSTTTAATPSSVKSAYDLANTAKTNAANAQSKADSAYTLANGKVSGLSDLGITATSTELNYVDGVTDNIQTQLNNKLNKTTYEYNKELALGSSGKVCIGKFPMYDSNISVEIKSTTNTTFNGTLIVATQNINTSGGGSYTAKVYGDADNSLTESIKIHYGSGSNVFSVYIDLPSWSKNLLHIQCVSLPGEPTDIASTVSEIPSNATIVPTNALDSKAQSDHKHSANDITSGTISASRLPSASGTAAGITIVYPSASCTTFSSDSGTITPLAAQKAAKMFAITRPTSSTNKAITRYSNTTGDVQDSKIIIEDVTNTKDSSKKAQVISIPAEGGKKMVYGYCTDQVDGTSFIGGVFDASATSYPYNQGLAIGGTSGNLLWKGAKVATTNDIPSAATTSAAGLMSAADKTKLDGIASGANAYSLPTASSSTLGGVKTTSTVTSTSGLTACPIISGVPYYKDTNNTYTLSSFGITSTSAELNVLDGITATTAELNYCDGVTSNIQTQLNGKAASSHGNHVPATQTANNAVFLRNDNTWQTVTPGNIGAMESWELIWENASPSSDFAAQDLSFSSVSGWYAIITNDIGCNNVTYVVAGGNASIVGFDPGAQSRIVSRIVGASSSNKKISFQDAKTRLTYPSDGTVKNSRQIPWRIYKIHL